MRTLPVILLAAVAGIAAGGALVYRGVAAQDNAYDNALDDAPVEIATGIVETPACALTDGEFAALEAATVGEVAAMRPLRREGGGGLSLAALPITAPDGSPTTLGEAGPGLTLLNLWATWCAPCRAEMPHLDELREARGAPGEDGFDVIALNVDTPNADPMAFLAEIDVDLPLYRDPTLQTFANLREAELAVGLPVTALIDREGCVLAAMNGPAAWNGPDALALIEAAGAL